MEETIISTDGVSIIKLTGRIDALSCGDFQKKTTEILDAYPQDIRFDCSGMTFLSSAGLRAFFIIVKKAKALKVKIILEKAQKNVREVLEISGFDRFMTVID